MSIAFMCNFIPVCQTAQPQAQTKQTSWAGVNIDTDAEQDKDSEMIMGVKCQ